MPEEQAPHDAPASDDLDGAGSWDVVTVLTLFVVLLTGVPAVLVLGPLGAVGTPANMTGLLCLAWWSAGRLVPQLGLTRGPQPIRVGVGLFVVGIVASYAHGSLRPMEVVERSGADRGLLLTAAWCGVALLAADGICCRARLGVLLRRLVWGVAFVAMLGILQFTIGLDLTQFLRVPGLHENGTADFVQTRVLRRVAGTATHPIEYGVVLASTLPLALHLARQRRPDERRLTAWVPVALIAVGVMFSISRSAVIVVSVGALVVLPTWPSRQRRRALALAPVFLVVMRVLVPGLVGTILNLFLLFGQDTSTTARTEDYAAVTGLIEKSPLFGIGFGTYLPVVYQRVLDNQFLLALVETGLVGLLLQVVLLAVGFCTARGARRASSDPTDRDLAQSLAAGLLGLSIAFVTFDALSFPMFAALLFLLLGLTGCLWRLCRRAPGCGHPQGLSLTGLAAGRVPARVHTTAAQTAHDPAR